VDDPLSPEERRHFEEVAWRGAESGDRDAVLTEIIAALDTPLTREDKRGGWDDALRHELRGFYSGVQSCESGRARLGGGETMRSLDAAGVTSGPLRRRILSLVEKLKPPDIAKPS
jgi:hypothetical protein